MKVSIYDPQKSVTLEEFETSEASDFISLVKQYGYVDENGVDYNFQNATVEYPHIIFIYVEQP